MSDSLENWTIRANRSAKKMSQATLFLLTATVRTGQNVHSVPQPMERPRHAGNAGSDVVLPVPAPRLARVNDVRLFLSRFLSAVWVPFTGPPSADGWHRSPASRSWVGQGHATHARSGKRKNPLAPKGGATDTATELSRRPAKHESPTKRREAVQATTGVPANLPSPPSQKRSTDRPENAPKEKTLLHYVSCT